MLRYYGEEAYEDCAGDDTAYSNPYFGSHWVLPRRN
jgi:hypothetical protein